MVEKEYANKWENSSRFFQANTYYKWMCEFVKPYQTIVEIGCGTGYSTLSLIESGHKVICVDNNQYCLDAAQELFAKSNRDSQSQFHNRDFITDLRFKEELKRIPFDCIVCWNIGTYYSVDKIKMYLPFFDEYGLTREQVASNITNSYSELMIWNACKLAVCKGSAVHIVERAQEVCLSTEKCSKRAPKR